MRRRILGQNGSNTPSMETVGSIWFAGYSSNPDSEWHSGNRVQYSIYTNPIVDFNISNGVTIDIKDTEDLVLLMIQPIGDKNTNLIIAERDEFRMRFYHEDGSSFTLYEYEDVSIQRANSEGILNFNGVVIDSSGEPYLYIPVSKTYNVPITNGVAGVFKIFYRNEPVMSSIIYLYY